MSDITSMCENTTSSGPRTVVVTEAAGGDVAARVVTGVTELRGCEMEELPTLADVVDPDALASLFDTRSGAGQSGSITFEYAECLVTVTATGEVTVEPAN